MNFFGDGGKDASRLRQKTAIDSDIFFAIQRFKDVITFKWLTNTLGFRMRVAKTLHIGNDK